MIKCYDCGKEITITDVVKNKGCFLKKDKNKEVTVHFSFPAKDYPLVEMAVEYGQLILICEECGSKKRSENGKDLK